MDIASQVRIIALDSLYKDNEVIDRKPPGNAVIVEGILKTFAFHPDRLESHRNEIKEILLLMPKEFQKSGGGGWSFLELCNTQKGELWTGDHAVMETLVCLAIGLKIAKFCLPRLYWETLPGQMPYIEFDVEGEYEQTKT